MELIDNKSQYWQGWNDFLGIKNDDTHNYIVNIIGDITDDFNIEAREKELGTILTSGNADSYLFFSEYVFKYTVRESKSWMQVHIYKIEEYFIIVKFNSEGVLMCRYVGKDFRVAFDFFRQEIKSSQSNFKTILDDYIQSEHGVSGNTKSKIDFKDYYLLTGYILPEITESYFEYLKVSLSSWQASKQSIH
jgi:hypothetical protein